MNNFIAQSMAVKVLLLAMSFAVTLRAQDPVESVAPSGDSPSLPRQDTETHPIPIDVPAREVPAREVPAGFADDPAKEVPSALSRPAEATNEPQFRQSFPRRTQADYYRNRPDETHPAGLSIRRPMTSPRGLALPSRNRDFDDANVTVRPTGDRIMMLQADIVNADAKDVRESKLAELKKELEERFDSGLAVQESELEQLEKRVKKLRDAVETRKKNRDRIIGNFIDGVVLQAEGLTIPGVQAPYLQNPQYPSPMPVPTSARRAIQQVPQNYPPQRYPRTAR